MSPDAPRRNLFRQYSGDHLSQEYHEALCLLGARLERLALEKPGELAGRA
jgi:hypothetical protein